MRTVTQIAHSDRSDRHSARNLHTLRPLVFVAGVAGAALMAYLGAPWWLPPSLVLVGLVWGAIDVWCWLADHRDDPPDDPDADEAFRQSW